MPFARSRICRADRRLKINRLSRLFSHGGIKSIQLLNVSLDPLAYAIGSTVGWRRAAMAIVLGLGAAAAAPPLSALPRPGPALTGPIWVLDGHPAQQTA